MGGANRAGGFTLAELMVVILLIGIVAGMGVSHYSGLTAETRIESTFATLSAFFQACRDRAGQRGTDVHVQVTARGIGIKESHQLVCALTGLTESSRDSLARLRFSGGQAFLGERPITTLGLDFHPDRGRPFRLAFEFGHH